ncbi:hypothetical protein CYG48_12835 [Neorhizobium sp. SOG26]|nr:hypothetical protein CYG48_12835 [Neorhizobium sp. SOG26]
MSSSLRLDRNLVSVSDFGYRENVLAGEVLLHEAAPAILSQRSRTIRLELPMLFQSSSFSIGLVTRPL